MRWWWPWAPKQVETVTLDRTPKAAPSEPPAWFKKLYSDYLDSEEGRRKYGIPQAHD